jgi:hypothetical protein
MLFELKTQMKDQTWKVTWQLGSVVATGVMILAALIKL